MNPVEFSKCTCGHCGLNIEFPVHAGGDAVNCPHCGQSVLLISEQPGEECPVAEPWAAFSPAQVAAAFQRSIRSAPTSFFYKTGLLVVTLTMVLLPLIYCALIGAAAWGVYWWATHGTVVFRGSHGQLLLLALAVYLAPLFAGVVVVFFMVKPLLARRPRAAQPLALNPASEPTLFALVRCICDAVRAPFPSRIDVDCQLNASAGFRRGWRSLLGNDLVLTIGMPLAAGLDARQFVGVLAHEFGHFSQGFGMRLTYIIQSINFWFLRVAYERDEWDVTLQEWAEDTEDWRVMIVTNVARVAVWFSRLLLKGLLYAGHAIGCFMLRQMEYNADAYQIHLAGSATFESAHIRLHVLRAALGQAYKQIRMTWHVGQRLPDSFPAFLIQHEGALPSEVRQRLEDTAGLGTTGMFDTHPTTGDRIREARRAAEPGIFEMNAPTSAFFSNFQVLARQVTLLHYADDLGIQLMMANLQPVEPSPGRSADSATATAP